MQSFPAAQEVDFFPGCHGTDFIQGVLDAKNTMFLISMSLAVECFIEHYHEDAHQPVQVTLSHLQPVFFHVMHALCRALT